MLRPVQFRRVSDDVAEQIRNLIFSREFTTGGRLPPERELAVRLEVHRSSVREALKRLEGEGLVEIRRGDGAYVRDYLQDANLASLESLLFSSEGQRSSLFRGIQEFRILVQKEMARLAAARRTEDNVAEIAGILSGEEATNDPHTFRELDWRFFLAVARATQNGMFPLVLNSVRDIHERWGVVYFSVPDTVAITRRFHRLLARAIRIRDERRAASIMVKLLEYSNPILLDNLPKYFFAGGSP